MQVRYLYYTRKCISSLSPPFPQISNLLFIQKLLFRIYNIQGIEGIDVKYKDLVLQGAAVLHNPRGRYSESDFCGMCDGGATVFPNFRVH